MNPSVSLPGPARALPGRLAVGLSGLRLGSTVGALAIGAALIAPAVRAEPLAQAVARAMVSNPEILASRTEAEAARFEITAADSQRNTRFGLIAQPGYSRIRGEGTDSTADFGFQAVKPIYDGSRTDYDVARQTAGLAAANQRVEYTRAAVAQRVADAYIEVLKQERLVALATGYVEVIDGLRRRVEEIVRLDRGRAYDLLQTTSRLNQAKLALASREGAHDEAFAALSQLVGAPVASVEAPAEPAIPARTLDAALAALEDHPAILTARAQVEYARGTAKIAAAWQKPTISVRGAVNSPEVTRGDRRWLGGYQVGLVTDWNPFDGGLGDARNQAAQAQVRAAEENVEAVRRQLGTEVTRHWSQVQSRQARAGSLSTVVSSTDQVRAAYWEQFQIGRRSMVDLLNAENETYQARVNAETELTELLQVRYRLVGALARLTDQLGIAPLTPIAPPDPHAQAPAFVPSPAQAATAAADRRDGALGRGQALLPPGAIMPPPPSAR